MSTPKLGALIYNLQEVIYYRYCLVVCYALLKIKEGPLSLQMSGREYKKLFYSIYQGKYWLLNNTIVKHRVSWYYCPKLRFIHLQMSVFLTMCCPGGGPASRRDTQFLFMSHEFFANGPELGQFINFFGAVYLKPNFKNVHLNKKLPTL